MNFEPRELNAIRRWSRHSRMNERDRRSVCANELPLRNAIIQKMVSGRNMAESPRLPETVPGSERIGDEPTDRPTKVVGLKCPPGTLPIESTARESTTSAPNTLGRSIVELGNDPPRRNYRMKNHKLSTDQKFLCEVQKHAGVDIGPPNRRWGSTNSDASTPSDS